VFYILILPNAVNNL